MPTFEELRQDCGFSETEFARFRHLIEKELEKPKNRIGLNGQGPHGLGLQREFQRKKWEEWLQSFVNNAGNEYWGQGTAETRKWSFPIDIDKIHTFLRKFVVKTTCDIRRAQAAAESLLLEEQLASSLSPNLPGDIGHNLKRKRSSSDTGQPKSKCRVPTVIEINSDEDPPSKSTSKCYRFYNPFTTRFSFETSIFGLEDIQLIQGVGLPKLADLINRIHQRHGLKPKQKIRDMKVMTGDKAFSIDLEDVSAWEYISGIIAKNGSRANIVVTAR